VADWRVQPERFARPFRRLSSSVTITLR